MAARSAAPLRLARASLAPVLLAMTTTGCLITSTPDFTAPNHTAPFLVASTAKPAISQVVTIDGANPPDLTFSADVISQDDPAGGTGPFQRVFARLYVDYGVTTGTGANETPYLWSIHSNTSLDPATLDQTTGRQVSVTWPQNPYFVDPGCHTATLIVSHLFDEVGAECPSCDDDYSMITWQVLRCDSTMGTCDDLPIAGPMGACPTQAAQTTNTCEAVHKLNGSMTCPGTTTGGGS